jgi:sorbose reductase
MNTNNNSFTTAMPPSRAPDARPTANVGDGGDTRAALTNRTIPKMTLSTADNPLTAPLPPLATHVHAAERAMARFAISGACVLTGGAGTLALAAARALLEHGASGIALWDLSTTLKTSSSIIQSLQSNFPDRTVSSHVCDVTDADSIALAMKTTLKIHGGLITTLCCFAGIVGCVPSIEANPAQIRSVIDVNLTGSFLCAQALARHFTASKHNGSILFTASISARATNYPQPQAAYNISKAGIVTLTKNLAAEWAVHGIRVNCVSPGYLDTVLNAGEGLREVREVWADRNPMGRMGDVEEIVGVVILCCAPRAGRYLNGSEIVVDGGGTCF